MTLATFVLWPRAVAASRWRDVVTELTGYDAVHVERIDLPNYRRARRFVTQMYEGEAFIGSEASGFEFADFKTNNVWRAGYPAFVVAFRAESDQDVIDNKLLLRDILGQATHSVHSSDDSLGAERMLRSAVLRR